MEEDVHIDKENGNIMWKDSMDNITTNSIIVFDVKKESEAPPIGYKYMTVHLYFLSFFWFGYRDQIACSLLGGISPIPEHRLTSH